MIMIPWLFQSLDLVVQQIRIKSKPVKCSWQTSKILTQTGNVFMNDRSSCKRRSTDSRLISTQENYPWIGTDKKIFLCGKSLVPTQSSQDKETFSCPFQTTDHFPEWKLAFSPVLTQSWEYWRELHSVVRVLAGIADINRSVKE
jgi:hypothetical protein